MQTKNFLSHSQNFEDLMLWRALQEVQNGFYIDVGAADPEEFSVSRAFYDRSWSGLNIEPSPAHFTALVDARPRDVTLDCVLGEHRGQTKFYNIPETGLSTLDHEIAERHASQGYRSEVIAVEVRTLADVLREYAPPDIHFLKIDVEGAEESVLRGGDFQIYRPWIIVVEATEPLSQVENWQVWEPLLIDAGYVFVWFDGLNRFYLASERETALRHAFRTPPNVFDNWLRPRSPQHLALLQVQAAATAAVSAVLAAAEEKSVLREKLGHLEGVEQRHAQAEAEVADLREKLGHLERVEHRYAQAEAEVAELRERLGHLKGVEQRHAQAEAEGAELRERLGHLERVEQRYAQAEAEGAELRERLGHLERVEQRSVRAKSKVAKMRASISWRVTAPLRLTSKTWRGSGIDFIWPKRIDAVSTSGPRQGTPSPERVVVHGLGRVAARVPGGPVAARLVRRVLPGPYAWLCGRYRSPNPPGVPPETMPLPPREQASDLPAQEQALLDRLVARAALR